jgi:hypothetical protein
MLELEKVVGTATDSPFLDKPKAIDSDYCFIMSGQGPLTAESGISKEGHTWYSCDHNPFRFVIPLKELTSGGKMIQFRRCVGAVLHEVVIDFNITVIKDAPDKVPEHLTSREGDGSAFLLKRAREGDGSARKGDG